jgi:hypothetical protein
LLRNRVMGVVVVLLRLNRAWSRGGKSSSVSRHFMRMNLTDCRRMKLKYVDGVRASLPISVSFVLSLEKIY